MKLKKFEGNPILTPNPENDWENLGGTMRTQLFNVYSDTTRYPAYPEQKKKSKIKK